MMLKGKATGGPRDGITLEAPESWVGTVFVKVRTTTYYGSRGVGEPRRYRGRYLWQDGGWIWIADQVPQLEIE